MRPRVLVCSYYDRPTIQPALDRLAETADVTSCDEGRSLRLDELVARLRGMQAVIAAEERYTREVFDHALSLRMIARDGVGLDSVDLAEATAHKVVVTNAPVVQESVADLTMGLILAVVRRIGIGDHGMREGRWQERDRYLSPDVNGACLGLIGLGAVGKAVARRAAGFAMRILAYDPKPDPSAARSLGVRLVELESLLAEADVVSLHVPLLDSTQSLINARRLALMKRGSFLINTSRGRVVDEAALLAALTSGHLAAAGLDVLSEEPPRRDHPLLQLPNVVATPHVGSDTYGTFRKVFETVVDDLLLFFSGKRPRHVVNPAVLIDVEAPGIANPGAEVHP